MEHLGFPSTGEDLEFPLYEDDFARLSQVHRAGSLKPGAYACVHPGAADPLRRWSPENFAAVADRLATEGLQIVLTGTAQERRLTAAVARRMKAPALDLAGQTDLGSLAALLSRARLLVCNDTGVSHLAAALHVPSVVVFTATDPARWAPLNGNLHRVVLPENGREQSLLHAQVLLNAPSYPGAWS
jgi:ADP-heptose:LPS heptosyltransferase